MPTAAEITDPLVWTYLTVLPAGAGVCDVCHGAPSAGYSRCYGCSQVMAQVAQPIRFVIPISLSRRDGQLHHSLRSYKNPAYRQHSRDLFSLQIAALFDRFVRAHRDCISSITEKDWNVITVVPSSRQRVDPHPLEVALGRSPWIADQLETLLTIGPQPATHNQASDGAYQTVVDVTGLHVLLVDDTFTTGARAQSAASVLTAAGAHVVAVVPAARYVNPEWPPSVLLLKRSTALSYSFEYCCVGDHPLPAAKDRSARS